MDGKRDFMQIMEDLERKLHTERVEPVSPILEWTNTDIPNLSFLLGKITPTQVKFTGYPQVKRRPRPHYQLTTSLKKPTIPLWDFAKLSPEGQKQWLKINDIAERVLGLRPLKESFQRTDLKRLRAQLLFALHPDQSALNRDFSPNDRTFYLHQTLTCTKVFERLLTADGDSESASAQSQ